MNVVYLGVSAGPDVSVMIVTTLLSLLGVATLMLLAWVAIAAPRRVMVVAQAGATRGTRRGAKLRPVLVTLLPCDAQRQLAGVRSSHPWELPGSSSGPTRAPPPPIQHDHLRQSPVANNPVGLNDIPVGPISRSIKPSAATPAAPPGNTYSHPE